MPERQFRVRGRVQGVGFRWWTLAQAERLGVTGTVRNCGDGSVEVRARGSDEQLARFRTLLADGPERASIDEVEETETRNVPRRGFDIIH